MEEKSEVNVTESERTYKEKFVDFYGFLGFLFILSLVFMAPIFIVCIAGGFSPIIIFWIMLLPALIILQLAGAAIFALFPSKNSEAKNNIVNRTVLAIIVAAFICRILIPFILLYFIVQILVKKKTWFQGKGDLLGRFFPVFAIAYVPLLFVAVPPALFVGHIFKSWYFNIIQPWFNAVQPWFEQIYNHIIFGI